MHREAKKVSDAMEKYLELNGISELDPPWIIRDSLLGGIGVFAKRAIRAGEKIFTDLPLIIGPRAVSGCPLICVKCYKNKDLYACRKGCGLPVCSQECDESEVHRRECKMISSWKPEDGDLSDYVPSVIKSLTPIRSLFLDGFQREVLDCLDYHEGPQHGFEVDALKEKFGLNVKEDQEILMRRVCCVMDTNSFEVLAGCEDDQSSLRGLYPLGSLMNHQCVPNTMHVFDEQQRMIVRATVDICEGSEIFHSYSRIIWSTLSRQLHLKKTKNFVCKCSRCCDPSEFGTNLGAIRCFKCGGILLPTEAHKIVTPWRCSSCSELFSQAKVGTVLGILGSVLSTLGSGDVKNMLLFLNNRLLKYVPECNQIVVEIKCKCIWSWGYREGYLWNDLADETLMLKASFCRDILNILDQLHAGKCKIRGLIVFELYATLKVLSERNNNDIERIPNNLEDLLEECCEILMDDVTAPLEIQERCKQKRNVTISNGFN